MEDIIGFLLFPSIAAFLFVGIHTWLGLQVLRRRVVFADLALAQLAALGGTVAVALEYPPGSTGAFAYALLFTSLGAVILTLLRVFSRHISHEALIGIIYVAATALTILVVDRSPQGAEHVKKLLVGSILTIGPDDVFYLALLYGMVGTVHLLCRRALLAATRERAARVPVMIWDFLFYASFGLVVTSSVSLAGVLVVFSFLIVPAVIGTLFSQNVVGALALGWSVGILASLGGFAASLLFDLPTGAVLVAAFASTFVMAVLLRVLYWCWNFRQIAFLVTGGVLCLALLIQGVWFLVAPGGDHPLVAVLQRASILRPERFLSNHERQIYARAIANEERYRIEVERLRDLERAARWQGDRLTEEDVQKISGFQRSYNEMGRGERFVQSHLLTLSRRRSRWIIGVPAIGLSILGLALIGVLLRSTLSEHTSVGTDAST